MNTHADKTQEPKSNAVANGMGVQQGVKQEIFQPEDNRPETIAQRKLQQTANNSPQSRQMTALQEMANNSHRVKQLRAIQVMANANAAENLLQKKDKQKVERLGVKLEHDAGWIPGITVQQKAGNIIQRKIFIDKVALNGDGEARKEQIKIFLKKHAVHFYYAYNTPAENIGIEEQVSYEEQEGAVALARKLGEMAGAEVEEDDGKQEAVQRKLLEVCELVRQSMDVRLTEQEERWFAKYVNDGLCLGFVKMLEKYPDWMTAMWEAMRTWNPPHGQPVLFIIDHLNKHIQQNVPFDEEGVALNFMEAAIMAKESYRLMDTPGEDAQYDDAPQFLKDIGVSDKTAVTETVAEEMVNENSDLAKAARWDIVREYIIGLATEEDVNYHVIIYTTEHEMAVRFVGSAAAATSITVSETESTGIVKKSSWPEVSIVVIPWLGDEGVTFGVEVKKQTRDAGK